MPLLIAVVVWTVAVEPAAAQAVSSADQQHADSLAALPDVDALAMWLAALDRPAPQGAVRLVEAVADMRGRGDAELADYARGRVSQADAYRVDFAGAVAARLFDGFAALVQTGDADGAVHYFEAARYARIRLVERTMARLATTAGRAETAIALGDFAGARAAIDSVDTLFGSRSTTVQPLVARLLALRGRADAGLASEARRDDFFSRTERPAYRFGLSLSGGVLSRGATGSVSLGLDPGSAFGDALTTQFEGAAEGGVGVEAYGFATRWLALGAGGSAGRLAYTNNSSNDPFFLDMTASTQSLYALARAYLRTEVGLRPYVGLGLGAVTVDRPAAPGSALRVSGNEVTEFRFVVQSERETGLQARGTLGVEYVSSLRSALALGAEVGVVRNGVESPLVDRWQGGLGVRLSAHF